MIDTNALHRLVLPVFLLLAASVSLAQESNEIPRLANGLPDLQGTWDFRTITPLQRPREFADQEVLTTEQAAEFEIARQEQLDRDNFTDTTTTGDYNQFWYDRGTEILGSNRTSLITYPPDGRIPELTEQAQERNAARREAATLKLRNRSQASVRTLHHGFQFWSADAAERLQQQCSTNPDGRPLPHP